MRRVWGLVWNGQYIFSFCKSFKCFYEPNGLKNKVEHFKKTVQIELVIWSKFPKLSSNDEIKITKGNPKKQYLKSFKIWVTFKNRFYKKIKSRKPVMMLASCNNGGKVNRILVFVVLEK